MSTKNRFQVMKTVGSPSVSGAERVETLANHTNNPSAHPDYLKKGAFPAYMDLSQHLTDKLGHAPNFPRRSEVTREFNDYTLTKNSPYVDSVDNYNAASPKRYIITSYVLKSVLENLGLDGSKQYIETKKIVGATSIEPTTNLDTYVVGFGLFKKFVADVESTYLSKTEAALTYAPILHTHDVMTLDGMPAVMGYQKTDDSVYLEGTSYYVYDTSSYSMVPDTRYDPGRAIVGDVFVKIGSASNKMDKVPGSDAAGKLPIFNPDGSGQVISSDSKIIDDYDNPDASDVVNVEYLNQRLAGTVEFETWIFEALDAVGGTKTVQKKVAVQKST